MNETLLVAVSATISAIIGWIVGFRKQNVDLCGQRLDELEKSILVYNNIISDMSKKILDLQNEIKTLETKIDELHDENKRLKKSL